MRFRGDESINRKCTAVFSPAVLSSGARQTTNDKSGEEMDGRRQEQDQTWDHR